MAARQIATRSTAKVASSSTSRQSKTTAKQAQPSTNQAPASSKVSSASPIAKTVSSSAKPVAKTSSNAKTPAANNSSPATESKSTFGSANTPATPASKSQSNTLATGTFKHRPDLTEEVTPPTPERPWVNIFEIQQNGSSTRRWIINFEADYDQTQIGNPYTGTYRNDPITYKNRVPMLALDANGNDRFDPVSDRPINELFDLSKMTPQIFDKLAKFTSTSSFSGTWTVNPDNTITLIADSNSSGPVPITPGLF